jgi:hypothetical protein
MSPSANTNTLRKLYERYRQSKLTDGTKYFTGPHGELRRAEPRKFRRGRALVRGLDGQWRHERYKYHQERQHG